MTFPPCAVLACTNTADPRWTARDLNGRGVMICDGHDPFPTAAEVRPRPPDPSALEIAERVVREGYAPSSSEITHVSMALIGAVAAGNELRELAFAIHADIELSPELREAKQRLIADRYEKLVTKAAVRPLEHP